MAISLGIILMAYLSGKKTDKTQRSVTPEEKFADCPDIKSKLDRFIEMGTQKATWSDLIYIQFEIIKDYRKNLP